MLGAQSDGWSGRRICGRTESSKHGHSSHERRTPSYRIRGGWEHRGNGACHELGRMEVHRKQLAAETAGRHLERLAGRFTGAEVHQPGNSAGENLAVSPPARANDGRKTERTEESFSRRFESSPGLCSTLPSRRSKCSRDPTGHRVATPQRARLPVGWCSETRIQAAFVLARRRACVPAQRLRCSRKAWNRCFCCCQSTRRATARRWRSRSGSGPRRVGGRNSSSS